MIVNISKGPKAPETLDQRPDPGRAGTHSLAGSRFGPRIRGRYRHHSSRRADRKRDLDDGGKQFGGSTRLGGSRRRVYRGEWRRARSAVAKTSAAQITPT